MVRIGILIAMVLLWALTAHEAWRKPRNPVEYFKIEGNTFDNHGACIGIGPEGERRCREYLTSPYL